MRTNKGFTLVELLVAMVVFIVVLGAAMSFLVTQSRTFRRGSDEMGVLQNMSFGADNLDSQLRTAGSNTVDNQPTVVYASANSFSFNSNYVTNDTTDIFAVYFDPDASAAQVEALKQANQIVIPASSPGWTYPSMDYLTTAGTTSTAELITLYFTPDLETSRTDDYDLMRQVNNNAPETLVRQVLPDSTNLPFFRYYILRPPAANQLQQLTVLPVAELPLKHTDAAHSANDTHQGRQSAGGAGELRDHQRADRFPGAQAADQPQHSAAEHGPQAAQDLRQRADSRHRPHRHVAAAVGEDAAHLAAGVRREFGREGCRPIRPLEEEDNRSDVDRSADVGCGGPGHLHVRRQLGLPVGGLLRVPARGPGLQPQALDAGVRVSARDSVAVTTTWRDDSMGTVHAPAEVRRGERGIALLTTLFVGFAVSAIALAGAFWILNSQLIQKNGERAAMLNDYAVAAVEEGRSKLNANPALYPPPATPSLTPTR